MSKLYNLARARTATTGTGTITLGSAVSGFLTFDGAGVQNGDVVAYAIRDGSNSEIGYGTYTSATATLTRNVRKSTNSDAAISLSGNAEVVITPSSHEFEILNSLTEFGAVGDGSSNDTTAVTAADADANPKFSPPGIYDTTLAATDLDGPYWGWGQIRTTDDNLRGPWFSAIKAAPASFGDESSIDTAFNGDLSGVLLPMEFRLTGAASAGQPSSGYLVTPEVSPIYIMEYNTAGHNQSTSIADGRTGISMLNLNYHHGGQGDFGAIWINGITSGTRSGATHFLASPAAIGIYGQLYSAATGSYLNFMEMSANDGGFQSAWTGLVLNANRTVATATLGEVWFAVRPQSSGAEAADVAYSGTGNWKRGLDLTAITFTSDKAAIALKADDRIYGNVTASGTVAWGQTVGTEWIEYDTAASAWIIVAGGNPALQVGSAQVTVTQAILASLAGNTARFVNTSDAASNQVARFESDRATETDNDEGYLSFMLARDDDVQTEFARFSWVGTDVNAGTSVDGRIDFAVVTAGSLADELSLTGAALYPSSSGGLDLGITSTNPFGNLFLSGNISMGATLTSGVGVSTGDAVIELGGARTGDGNVYIDFHATSGSDFECRFLRLGGANGAASFANTGTGDFSFIQGGAGALIFQTASTTRLSIAAGGGTDNVGLFQTDSFRIDQAASSIGTGVKTISNGADSSTNFGKYFSFSLNGTTVYVPCGTVEPT